jgi:uncharacterized protein YkwD
MAAGGFSRRTFLGCIAAAALGLRRAAPASADEDTADELVALVNAERRTVGLPELLPNAALRAGAQAYAEEMARAAFFSHRGVDSSTIPERAEAAGYDRWVYLGENLGRAYPTPARTVAAWMASPRHRTVILEARALEIGAGHAVRRGIPYWVIELGATGLPAWARDGSVGAM